MANKYLQIILAFGDVDFVQDKKIFILNTDLDFPNLVQQLHM